MSNLPTVVVRFSTDCPKTSCRLWSEGKARESREWRGRVVQRRRSKERGDSLVPLEYLRIGHRATLPRLRATRVRFWGGRNPARDHRWGYAVAPLTLTQPSAVLPEAFLTLIFAPDLSRAPPVMNNTFLHASPFIHLRLRDRLAGTACFHRKGEFRTGRRAIAVMDFELSSICNEMRRWIVTLSCTIRLQL